MFKKYIANDDANETKPNFSTPIIEIIYGKIIKGNIKSTTLIEVNDKKFSTIFFKLLLSNV